MPCLLEFYCRTERSSNLDLCLSLLDSVSLFLFLESHPAPSSSHAGAASALASASTSKVPCAAHHYLLSLSLRRSLSLHSASVASGKLAAIPASVHWQASSNKSLPARNFISGESSRACLTFAKSAKRASLAIRSSMRGNYTNSG